MNISMTLKTFALLCALPLSTVFASLPADDPLQARFAAIDAMPDYEVLSEVVPIPQDAGGTQKIA